MEGFDAFHRGKMDEKVTASLNGIDDSGIFNGLDLLQAYEAGQRAQREALEEAQQKCSHNIPFYAYGDNQAAVELADRLSLVNCILLQQLAALESSEQPSTALRQQEADGAQ